MNTFFVIFIIFSSFVFLSHFRYLHFYSNLARIRENGNFFTISHEEPHFHFHFINVFLFCISHHFQSAEIVYDSRKIKFNIVNCNGFGYNSLEVLGVRLEKRWTIKTIFKRMALNDWMHTSNRIRTYVILYVLLRYR